MKSDADSGEQIDVSEAKDPELATPDLEVGDIIGERYRVHGPLGMGGIGAVYRAVQLPLERPVAIKLMHDEFLALPELRARFEREARILSALTHPHVVSISDYGIDGERPYLVMELLEGRTLEELVQHDPIDPDHAMYLGRQLLSGLAFAHERGVAHRDLKPANVFLTKMSDHSEHVKLLDFGLASMVEGDNDTKEVTLTKRGVVFGTPAYMSPEQAAGSETDARSDVYSAAVLLFELLTGRRPYVGETRADLLRSHLTEPVPRLQSVRPRLRVTDDITHLIETAMAKDPEDRFQDAGQMLAAFDALERPSAWLTDRDVRSDAPTEIPHRPKGGTRTRALQILLAVLLVGGGLALVYNGSTLYPPVDHVQVPGPVPETIPEPVDPLPPDPFAEPPPEPLRPFLEMVENGTIFEERREITILVALAREMPNDARPVLLLGHLFVAKMWLTEGIRRYRLAYERDPASRGDRRMLGNLIELASRDSVGDQAADLLVLVYGTDALDALAVAIVEMAEDPLAQLKLVQLRDRIQGVEQPSAPK